MKDQIMKREYQVGNARRIVHQFDDIVALRIAPESRHVSSARAHHFGEEVRHIAELNAGEMASFRAACWAFVKPSRDVADRISARKPVPGVAAVGRLVKLSDRRMGIVTKRLNVQLRKDLSIAQTQRALAEHGLKRLGRLRIAANLHEVEAAGHDDAIHAHERLVADHRFTLAEPIILEHISARDGSGNPVAGPLYSRQWHLKNHRRDGTDVHARAAWEKTSGAGVRVAVIDFGFANHEDLEPAVDRIGSGHFAVKNGRPVFVPGLAGMPRGDHGTFVAGVVGARRSNGHGGCGVAPDCELMLIAPLHGAPGLGDQNTLARAVTYAANPRTEGVDEADGADIIVCGLGPRLGADWHLSEVLRMALAKANRKGRHKRGTAIFWAASNGNVDIIRDEVVSDRNVVAVVLSTQDDRYGNVAHGPTVKLMAPGVGIFSTDGYGGYDTRTGNSYAAACAAGCAALALSANTALTSEQLCEIMYDSADKVGGVYDDSGHNERCGYGRVNAGQAVRLAMWHRRSY